MACRSISGNGNAGILWPWISKGKRWRQKDFFGIKRECESTAGSDRIERGLIRRIMNYSAPDYFSRF